MLVWLVFRRLSPSKTLFGSSAVLVGAQASPPAAPRARPVADVLGNLGARTRDAGCQGGRSKGREDFIMPGLAPADEVHRARRTAEQGHPPPAFASLQDGRIEVIEGQPAAFVLGRPVVVQVDLGLRRFR